MIDYSPFIGDPRDPACPYDEDFTLEDEEALYDEYVDSCIDARLEER